MRITIMGTGTSLGVPMLGCACAVCTSDNPKDQRLRTAVLIRYRSHNIAIDVGPDFRQQMLRARAQTLDAVLLTHEHNDHVIGMDELRAYNFTQGGDMPIYGASHVLDELKVRFAYAFGEKKYPGAPAFKLHPIKAYEAFDLHGLHIEPLEVIHGRMPVLAFRIGTFAYVTDAKTLSEKAISKLKGIQYLVLNALRFSDHHSHMNVAQALAVIEKIQPQKTYLTHISHQMGLHEVVSKQLPVDVALAYDGLEIEIIEPAH